MMPRRSGLPLTWCSQRMIPDLDTYRTANVLAKRHGEDAPVEAAMRADAMLEAGDLDGHAVWKRILWAVREVLGDRGRLLSSGHFKIHQCRNEPPRMLSG